MTTNKIETIFLIVPPVAVVNVIASEANFK